MTSSECRNIFIIRNSDLSITSEDKFYDSIGARLMGLRTGEITNVKANLREIGKITPSNNLKNEIKERVDNSKDLLGNIDELILQIEKEDLDKLETENIDLNNELNDVEQKINLVEDARKREIYEKGNAALTKLKDSVQNLDPFRKFNQEDQVIWREAQRDIENNTKTKDESQKTLEINKNVLSKKIEELNAAEQNISEMTLTKQKLNEEIKPKITEYQTNRDTVVQQNGKNKFLTGLSSLFAVIFLTAIAGILFSQPLFFYALAAISGLLLGICLVTKMRYVSNKTRLEGLLDSIKVSVSKYNLNGESIEELLPQIQKFETEYETKSTKLTDLKVEKQTLENKVNELQNITIPAIDSKIGEINKQIGTIIGKSGVPSLEKYSECLSQKATLENAAGQQGTILGSIFQTELEKPEERLSFWENEIEEFEEFKDNAKETKYSDKALTEYRTRQSQIGFRQNEINDKLATAKEDFKEIERRASEILRFGECIKCETPTDLKAIKSAVVEFVEDSENGRNDVLEALSIFEEIESEEKNKVSTLFGDGSKVSEYFREITNGFYKVVRLNTNEKKIQMERNDGEIFDAEQLSAGTYDQLYLSIRLALGEKLLKGEKAFFIMDDPFIKSDKNRLKNQMNILTKISQSGWQILYFSAKDEVKEALKEFIDNGAVNLLETRAVAR